MKSSKIKLFLAGALMALLPVFAGAALAQDQDVWEYYKARFIQQDGRVIDFANKQMSHSEGQGFSMYLALTHGDKALFDRLWTWTRDNLMVPGAKGLAAWSWGRRDDGSWGVLDLNNATDGDIFLAWTLLRAGERFGNAAYLEASGKIAAALREELTREEGGRLVLLPGREGFAKPGETAFNPSYFIFPAFYDLTRTGDPGFWRRLHADSLELLEKSLSGPLGLPPDWAVLSGGVVKPWGEKGAHFSYDAIRVPLYLSWDLNRAALARFEPLLALFRDTGRIPARLAVVPGATDQGEAPAGFYAVLARAAQTLGDAATAQRLQEKAHGLLQSEKDDYYSHALYLLCATRGLQ